MNKTSFAFMAIAASLSVLSCQKEIEPAGTPSGPMVINAVSEGMGIATRVEMAYKYDLLWQRGDRIYVTDGNVYDTFTLSGGEGTTKGAFAQDGTASFSGDVQAFYPGSIAESGDLIWPAVQDGQTVPMYSKKRLSGSAAERMDFASLGAVLQIVFNTTQSDVTIQKIEIKDGGKAIITATNRKPLFLHV